MQQLLRTVLLSMFLYGLLGISLSAADKDEEVEEGPVRQLTNQAYMSGFRQYAMAFKLKLQEYGNGPVRILAAGNVGFGPEEAVEYLKIGEQVLQGLEIWTGKQDMFMPRTKSEADAYCIALVENEQHFLKFLEFLRSRGTAKVPDGHEDLAKAYKSINGPRCWVTHAGKFNPIAKNWMANMISTQALSTYFYERGENVPVWLDVGVTTEMERIMTGKTLILKVSYEKNDSALKDATGNWARDFSQLIKKGPQTELLTAHQAMNLDLIGMSYNQYIQLWSIGSFIRAVTAKGSKKKNKFAKIIQRMANGEVDSKVLVDVFGKSDRNLTVAWHAWARKQK